MIEATLVLLAFVLGFFNGVLSKARETHIHYHEKEVKIPIDEEGKPVYNHSVGDPEVLQWLNMNK